MHALGLFDRMHVVGKEEEPRGEVSEPKSNVAWVRSSWVSQRAD